VTQRDDSVLAAYGLSSAPGQMPGGGMSDWAVPWSDMMMILCVLFVVLFVYASTHKDVTVLFRPGDSVAAATAADPAAAILVRLGDRGVLLRAPDGREVLFRSDAVGVSVIREPDGVVRVTLRGAAFFQPGKSELSPEGLKYLSEVTELLRVHGGLVHVVGHVDESEAPGPAGFDLSVRRAAGVAKYFLEQGGLDPRRLLVSGQGAFRPESPAGLDGSAERNRRVEILLLSER
jgi:chemotaxis protein MotB